MMPNNSALNTEPEFTCFIYVLARLAERGRQLRQKGCSSNKDEDEIIKNKLGHTPTQIQNILKPERLENMSPVFDYTKYEPIDAGSYPAKIASIEPVTGQFGDQLKFTFELAPNEEGEAKKLLGWCSAKFSSKSKLCEWTRAILFGGSEIPQAFRLDTDELIGKPVTLLVGADSKDGEIVNKVNQVLPFKKSKPAPPPPEDW